MFKVKRYQPKNESLVKPLFTWQYFSSLLTGANFFKNVKSNLDEGSEIGVRNNEMYAYIQ
jgi:hypothetical protein